MNTRTSKNSVGLRELRENMEAYIRRVQRGESITVFRRSTPLFQISPIHTKEATWETIADFTQIDEKGVSGKKILDAIKRIDG